MAITVGWWNQVKELQIFFTPLETLNTLSEIVLSFRKLTTLDIWSVDEAIPISVIKQIFRNGKLRKFRQHGIFPPHSLEDIGACRQMRELNLFLYKVSFKEFKAILSLYNLRKLSLEQIPAVYLLLLVPLHRPKLLQLGLGIQSIDELSLRIIAKCFPNLTDLKLNGGSNHNITKAGNLPFLYWHTIFFS